ncbi:RNA polymerase sigma-70 factor (ECF subfamily) [Sphingobium sp. OAS761]|uniref:sigma-70 family RNA polymerase sigma factor n=1 Tax=Sphingobium sp. OAS761 TaxID=2817901 RepID=UPI0020A1247C|nr:sigma-70 family RNA polymerase sigma factor [Sphingobium sp. OAS761]MCP1469038.1 RNA polymerase sigma-70 factor (ECF subfamily) [Sphingobium sp. OAS761]
MRPSEDFLKQLMTKGLDGDAAAHAQLLRALLPLLRGFYRRRMAGQDADIEDLVQDTLIAVHQRRITYDVARPFTSWLFAVARYKMIDHFRTRGRSFSIEDLDEILVTEGFAERSDASADVDRLLRAIPPKQAAAIRATKIEGLSVTEAAARFALGESDIKISVHRGLKALANRVKDSLK